METRPCPSCERGNLVSRGGKGRHFPHRVFRELELPADVELPTCDHCGKIIFNPRVAAAFDEGMARAFQARLSQLISDSLAVLTPRFTSQQDLERSLGLSRGYISKLKGGKESSPAMAALLELLAAEPRSRLRELEELWAGKKPTQATPHVDTVVRLESVRVGTTAPKGVPSARRFGHVRFG